MLRQLLVGLIAGVAFLLLDGVLNVNPMAQRLYAAYQPIARYSVNALAGSTIDLAFGVALAGLFSVLRPSLPGRSRVAKALSFELNECVHRYHQDTSREIWKRYASTHLEPAVASAVAAGVLRKEELPSELLQHIGGLIEFSEHELSAS